MGNTDAALQSVHMLCFKHILYQAVGLSLTELAVRNGYDTGRILASVLKHSQSIIQRLVYRSCSDDSRYSTHNNTYSLLYI